MKITKISKPIIEVTMEDGAVYARHSGIGWCDMAGEKEAQWYLTDEEQWDLELVYLNAIEPTHENYDNTEGIDNTFRRYEPNTWTVSVDDGPMELCSEEQSKELEESHQEWLGDA